MTTRINKLPTTDIPSLYDLLIMFLGTSMRLCHRAILDVYNFVVAPIKPTMVYASPGSNGLSQSLSPIRYQWLSLTPLTALSTFTILFPPVANSLQNDVIKVTSAAAISTLTLSGNGATVATSISSISPTAPLEFTFDSVASTWYVSIP